jgi:hypothetical protein
MKSRRATGTDRPIVFAPGRRAEVTFIAGQFGRFLPLPAPPGSKERCWSALFVRERLRPGPHEFYFRDGTLKARCRSASPLVPGDAVWPLRGNGFFDG